MSVEALDLNGKPKVRRNAKIAVPRFKSINDLSSLCSSDNFELVSQHPKRKKKKRSSTPESKQLGISETVSETRPKYRSSKRIKRHLSAPKQNLSPGSDPLRRKSKSDSSRINIPKRTVSEHREKDSELSSVESKSDSSIIWKKNPEAEAIRNMLMKQLDLQESEDKRTTIKIEPRTDDEKDDVSIRPNLQGKRNPKKNSLLRNSRRRLKTISLSSSNATEEFSITRDDKEAPLRMLTDLRNDFSSFSAENSDAADDSESESDTTNTRPNKPLSKSGERLDKRTQIVLEIRSTERSYVHQLSIIVEKYLHPITKQFNEDPQNTKINCSTIFSNISEIYELHQEFMGSLDTLISNWSCDKAISPLFSGLVSSKLPKSTIQTLNLQQIPKLCIYSEYGSNYDLSLDSLKEHTKDTQFVNFLKICFDSYETNLKLESLLIAPIQRVPRYILLLRDLHKNTLESQSDYEALKEVIQGMQQVADSINKHVIQSKFKHTYSDIIHKAKELKHKDRSLLFEIVARCEKKRQNIDLFVFNDLFIHLSENKAKNRSNLSQKKFHWPLELIWIKERNGFTKIIGPNDVYCFRTTEIMECLPVLQRAINERLALLNHLPEPLTVSSSTRYGSFDFLETHSSYEGAWTNGKLTKGKLLYTGNVYEGEFKRGCKSGNGKLISMFQYTYEGQWENDRPNGKGEMVDNFGNKYSGYFENGMKHGQGTMRFASGGFYEGSWAHNDLHGVGSMSFPNGTVYAGNFEYGRFHHYGVLTSEDENGYKFEGMWNNGLREGKGRYMSPSETYDGSWKADLRDGIGTLKNYQGVYEGEWVAGCKEGKGTIHFSSGDIYSGQWRRNVYHGVGKLVCKRGIVKLYEGEWQSGRKCGKGNLVFQNGDVFEGFFKDDMMHGTGMYTYSEGSILEGKWVRGRLEGKVIFTKENTRKTYHATCKEDLLSFDIPGIPIELHYVSDIQQWHY